MPIADRWHLLHNLGAAILTVIEQQYRTLQHAATPSAPTVPAALVDQAPPAVPREWQFKPQHIQAGIAQLVEDRFVLLSTILTNGR